VSVKVKVWVSNAFPDQRNGFSCTLPYNYFATSSARLQIPADEVRIVVLAENI